MKLTFLGSSHGVPEKNRRCTSMKLEIGEDIYLIDAGTNPMDHLRDNEIPVERVKGVFVSHKHGDHLDGLIPFVDIINWYYQKADPMILLPDVRCVDGVKAWCAMVTGADSIREGIRFGVIQPGVIFDQDGLRVTAFATRHCENSFSFLLEAEGKRILYTGDMAAPPVDFVQAEADAGLDLLVCEGAHFSPMEYVSRVKGRAIRKMVWTHYSSRFFEDFAPMKAEIAPIPVELAVDGLTVEI